MRLGIYLLFIGSVWGQPLPTLIDEALRGNPEIAAARQRYEGARLRPSQASALADPTVSLGYTSNGGFWPAAGIGTDPTSNIGFMVTQELPFPGKRKLRAEVAGAEADAEQQAYDAVRLSVVSRLKQAYHELHHAMVAAEYVRKDQAILRDILRITEARYTTGHAAQQDVFKAQAQYAIFETQAVRFDGEKAAKEAAIVALLGRAPGGHIEAVGEMTPGELGASLEELLAAARTDSPVLARERKMIDRAQLKTNLAVKDKMPDYALSGGYFNQGGIVPMWQFRIDVKLPAWHKQKQDVAIRERRAGEAEAQASATAARRAIEASIQQEFATATAARKLTDLYQDSVLPQSRLALESSLVSYRTGSTDFLAVFSNFMTTVEYELMYHEEVMRLHVAKARIEEMTGREF
jgi:cobalt-zinc-cadmium efflux system outer membrane protein